MIVYDLACADGHRFEGWFAGAQDFERQLREGLLTCPVCEAGAVRRVPAPSRINTGKGARPVPDTAGGGVAELLRKVRELAERSSEDVGERFAEEARRIHYGETEHRNIRGQASAEEVKSLTEEGVPVLPLPPNPDKLN
ncbi:DUF1178 family protein [Ectothiorhodospiraceae bacterium 2226]|nr:DUF1178 family protein [Ectothiorhodospiraceae bacterium 2226]